MATSTRLVIVLAFTVFVSACQAYIARTILPHEGIRAAQYDVWLERDVALSTTDGVRLVANIYHPRVEHRTPVILVRIPY